MPSSWKAVDITRAVKSDAERVMVGRTDDAIVVVLNEFTTVLERCLRELQVLVGTYSAEPADDATAGARSPRRPAAAPFLHSATVAESPSRLIDERLTPRQQDVLDLVVVGLTNRAIANRLGISERTVKNHLHSIFRRLDVADRTQAALRAIGYEAADYVSVRRRP